MKPTYLNLEYTGNIRYSLTVCSKVTIVRGDSAIGKTIMLDAFCDTTQRDHDDRVVEFRASQAIDSRVVFRGYKPGTIVFIDEDSVEALISEKCLRYAWKCPVFLVLITRLDSVDIPYGLSDIYTLKTEGTVTKAVHLYPKYDALPKVNRYICEDGESGCTYFKNYLTNCSPMEGRYNWDKDLEDIDNTCLIMDAAALGSLIRDILHSGFKLCAPQSFEYLLLKCFTTLTDSDFIRLLEPKHLTYERLFNALCCDTQKYLGFQYSKSRLPNHVYAKRLLPELYEYEDKHRSKVLSSKYLDSPTKAKVDAKQELNNLLRDIGQLDSFNAVYDLLPEYVENDTFVTLVFSILNV